MKSGREQRIEQAFFRGESLTLENPLYARAFGALSDSLLQSDTAAEDLTAEALGLEDQRASATILAREPGVIAGIAEFAFLVTSSGATVSANAKDGNPVSCGAELLQTTGSRSQLLSMERVGLNLLQRMSGIATITRSLQERVRNRCSTTRVVATRKTPWGLLDKRAVHLGGGGTHRLGLWDAILIKNNHLALIADREEKAAPLAIQRAWNARRDTAFIEIEVRGISAALAAAKEFCRLQEQASEHCPCILMLDNMTPQEIDLVLQILRRERLWDHVLIEASGRIDETNVEEYATTGVDAISVGALTHSARALDLSQRIS
jgi:nicotinate-nucleotide pyrophosphorylase (carboxylating)